MKSIQLLLLFLVFIAFNGHSQEASTEINTPVEQDIKKIKITKSSKSLVPPVKIQDKEMASMGSSKKSSLLDESAVNK